MRLRRTWRGRQAGAVATARQSHLPAHPTPSGVTHPARQADNETCTYGCGAAVWAGLAFGSELTRYLCSINATVEPQTCSDPYLNQACHVTHGTVAAASNPAMFSKATF